MEGVPRLPPSKIYSARSNKGRDMAKKANEISFAFDFVVVSINFLVKTAQNGSVVTQFSIIFLERPLEPLWSQEIPPSLIRSEIPLLGIGCFFVPPRPKVSETQVYALPDLFDQTSAERAL